MFWGDEGGQTMCFRVFFVFVFIPNDSIVRSAGTNSNDELVWPLQQVLVNVRAFDIATAQIHIEPYASANVRVLVQNLNIENDYWFR